MSTTTTTTHSDTAVARGRTRAGADPDLRPPMTRLTEVELRKAIDTRAGFWLLIAVVLLTVAVVVIRLTVGPGAEHTLQNAFQISSLGSTLLLPVVGILLVTGEWSQRTALTTFGLVPVRGRVVVAKLFAVLLLGVAATVVCLLSSVAGFAVAQAFGGGHGGWSLTGVSIGYTLLAEELNLLIGVGFGLLLLNSAAATVTYFVIPMIWSILGTVVTALHTTATWLDLTRTTSPLSEPTAMTGAQWQHLGVSCLVWMVLPMLAGWWRLRRREIS
jgi:ABC-type transport system involved in multi-copper enzyme maturation permease subunit